MFSTEYNGYKKQEVDEFLSALKTEHEKALMKEKLKVLETEKKIFNLKKQTADIEKREKNVLQVLQSFKKIQNEGNNNIEILRSEQLKMIYIQLQNLLQGLDKKYPGILLNNDYKKLVFEIENILENSDSKKGEIVKTGTQNDPMRLLLSKMNEKKVQEECPREIKIERVERVDRIERNYERPSQIKPVTEMQLEENDNYDNLVDKFLNTAPVEEDPKVAKIQSNGFDLKEAINPKDDLSEIMKAFDFYSDDNI